MKKTMTSRHPMAWIPSLYFAEGVPYVIVMTIAVVMYKRLGLNNTEIALYTSWLYLPWVIKPFWSPVVDLLKTKRWWILAMQLMVGTGLAGVALTLPTAHFVQYTLAFFWLMAFSSATHDIAADGFYMLELNEHEQALYVGVRSTCYRIATIAGQGLLVILAGSLETYFKLPSKAWMVTFMLSSVLFFGLYLYHLFFLPNPEKEYAVTKNFFGLYLYHLFFLPNPEKEYAVTKKPHYDVSQFFETFLTYFKKPGIKSALAFMLLFRFPEALLVKICPLFFLDKTTAGGLSLTTSEIGLVQGTTGVIGLLAGGILGGVVIAKDGFQKWIWPMVLSISLPNIVYIGLAYFQPEGLMIVNICVFFEQMGYGFGFTAYMLFLICFAQGPSQTAHYAFCTGFMALSMMLPGMFAGWLQESVGYLNFFLIVMALTPLTFLVSHWIKVDPKFGQK